MAKLSSTTVYGDITVTGIPKGVDNIFKASGSETNINSGSWTNVQWSSTDISDSAYEFDGTNVTFEESGTFKITAEVDFTSGGGSRANPNIRILKNGTQVGVIGRSGYMRDAEGHDHASSHARALVEVNDGDTVHAEAIGDGDTSNTITPDNAQFIAERKNR